MVPVQLVSVKSSPSSRPYEQASRGARTTGQRNAPSHEMRFCLDPPAPSPFSPFSNSSSKRKLRGTLAPIVTLHSG